MAAAVEERQRLGVVVRRARPGVAEAGGEAARAGAVRRRRRWRRRRAAGNPLQQNPDPGATVGVDLKYAVTPALTLTGTVNPDFGQVEADPAVVNLGAFETFFDERRPFFIEGSGNYQFDCRDCNLFYSRRIGRAAARRSDARRRASTSIQPLQSTILGAGKLTGRVGSFSVGALAAATQEEDGARSPSATAAAARSSSRRRSIRSRAPGASSPISRRSASC